ncbi:MAG: SpvB/TcaC N-terminal domain-containing protein [Gammaproteobacteria bacterium]
MCNYSTSLIKVISAALVAVFTVGVSAAIPNKSGVSAGAISLPSGPGSIEGLGESFEPNLSTGSARHSIPINVPPGRNGATPRLALSYDSGMGNGVVGTGWQLTSMHIRRQSDKGLPEYGTGSTEDTFVTESGAELVRVVGGADDLVQTFRLKNEGQFSRYVFFADDNRWQITGKDGVVYAMGLRVDGTDVGARIMHPEIENAAYSWHLAEVVDLNGNQILYTYSEDQNQVYCDEIRYGFLGTVSPAHVITFLFEDGRPDPVVDYRSTFRLVTAKRLSGIEITSSDLPIRSYSFDYHSDRPISLLSQVTYIGSDGESTLPPSEFTYSNQSLQTSASLVGLPDLLGAKLLLEGESPDDSPESSELMDFDGNGLPDLYRSRDVTVSGDKDEIFLNMGAGSFEVQELEISDSLGFEIQASRSFVRDIDGDGDCDVVAQRSADPEDLAIKLNGGGAWEAGNIPVSLPGGVQVANVFSGEDVRALDLNFDKKIDSIRSRIDTVGGITGFVLSTYLNNGDGTITSVPASSNDVIRGVPPETFSGSNGQLVMADINGDRLADLVHIRDASDGGPKYWPSMGMGKFDDSTFGYSLTLTNGPNYGGAASLVRRIELGDLNGDGLADLYQISGSILWYWLNEGGTQFGSRQTVSFGKTFDNDRSTYRLLDIDGDGLKEILFYTQLSPSPGDLPAGISYIRLFADNRSKREDGIDNDGDGFVDEADEGNSVPNLLSTISNGIGEFTSIGYTPSVYEMQRDIAAGSDWNAPPPFSIPVVNQVDVFDGLRSYQKQYAYHDGYYDGIENEFRGFGKVDQTEIGDVSAPTLVTELMFDTGQSQEARKGLLLGVKAKTESGLVFFDQTTQWNTRELAAGASGESRRVTYPFMVDTTRNILEKGQGTPVSVAWEYEFDNYGNQTSVLELGRMDGGWDDERKTTTIYSSNYPANVIRWVLDKPVSIEVSDENGVRVSESLWFYNDNTALGIIGSGNVTRKQSWIEDEDWLIDFTGVYDSYGNMTERRDGLYGVEPGHRRIYTFDPVHKIYPVKEEIDTGVQLLTLEAGYDYGFGLVTRSEDTNGHPTTYQYDVFGRPKFVIRPGDTMLSPTMTYDYQLTQSIAGSGTINWIETKTREIAGGGTVDKRTFFDGRGQAVMTRSEGELSGQVVVSDAVQFNARGVPSRQILPYFETGLLDYTAPDLSASLVSIEYDALLRPVRNNQPDGSFSTVIYHPLMRIHSDEEQTRPGSIHSGAGKRIVFDGLGAKDTGGRVRQITEIVKIGPLGEPLAVPAEWLTTYSFDLLDKVTGYRDSQNNEKTLRYDGLKRLVFVNDPDRGVITYEYDDVSNLMTTLDAQGQTNRYEYDGANRLRKEFLNNTTDTADVEYHYDTPFGPIDQGDYWSSIGPAAIQRAVLGRDVPDPDFDLNGDGQIDVADVVAASQSTNTITAQNTMGFLSWVRDESGEEHNSYDHRGRNDWTIKRVKDQNEMLRNFYTGRTFDSMDRVRNLVYPDQSSITYTYNDRGLMESIPGIVADLNYDPVANISSYSSGSGLNSSYTYDSRLRLKTLTTTRSADSLKLQDFTYIYDYVSNVTDIVDGRSDAQLASIGAELGLSSSEALEYDANQSFVYDSLYRLTQAKNESVYGTVDYRYDRIGNMIMKNANLVDDLPGMNLGTISFGGESGTSGRIGRAAGDAAGPHAVTQAQFGGLPELIYSDNGNVASEGSTVYGWDSKDRLAQITNDDAQAEYIYDYRSTRRSKVVTGVAGDNSEEVLYVNASSEVRNGQLYKFVHLREKRVARATQGATFAVENYYLFDHLGSAHVSVDDTFSVSEHRVSYPFGTPRLVSNASSVGGSIDFPYTGKELDAESDWFYFEARYLQSTYGSFASVDPLDQLVGRAEGSGFSMDPQSLNRYSYVLNNPLIYRDPDGNAPQVLTVPAGAAIGAAYGLLTGLINEVAHNGFSDGALGRVTTSTVKGAAIGAAGGLGGPPAAYAVAATLAGAQAGYDEYQDGGSAGSVAVHAVAGASLDVGSRLVGGAVAGRYLTGAVDKAKLAGAISGTIRVVSNETVAGWTDSAYQFTVDGVQGIGESFQEFGNDIKESMPNSVEELARYFSPTPQGPEPN